MNKYEKRYALVVVTLTAGITMLSFKLINIIIGLGFTLDALFWLLVWSLVVVCAIVFTQKVKASLERQEVLDG